MRFGIKKIFAGVIILIMAFVFLNGCDSGDKVIDEATGNRALEQYQAAKDKLNVIDKQQKGKYQNLPGDESQGSQ